MLELGITAEQYKKVLRVREEREAKQKRQEGTADARESTDRKGPLHFSVPPPDEMFTNVIKSAERSLSGSSVPGGAALQPNRAVFRRLGP